MRTKLALVLLSAWITLTVGMAAVAAGNFRTVDRVLEPGYRPELLSRLAPRTPAEERPLLRYLASELNRRFFRWSGWTQLALAAALLVVVLPDPVAGGAVKLASALAAAIAGALS